MPLTPEEREFLDAYVFEATQGPPFGGPATRDLAQRGVWYSDLSWILTAYQRELWAEGKPATGIQTAVPPPSPWPDLETVKNRGEVLKKELERVPQPVSREPKRAYSEVRSLFDAEEIKRRKERSCNDPGRTLDQIIDRLRRSDR